ncbi:MAG: winged helix-turn-helix transcriptional regulator [Calditrichia bacterium]|nr:winged helix-turn-helix transcriptional regulator [Calditrichia bacterium]
MLNRKDYTQDIITNINNALHFIKQELRVKYEMTGTARRKEIYELPLDAIREAVVNAVVHRDYFLAGSHTVIEIFDERVEISNPGGLPKGLSKKDFGKKAVRRNQIIASLLHRIDFVENMGTGINKIRTLLKKSGAAPPQFEFGDFFTITFLRKEREPGTEEKSSEKIIKLIKENPETSAESLAQMIGISPRAVEKHLAKLKQKGILKRIGPAKGGYWEIEER